MPEQHRTLGPALSSLNSCAFCKEGGRITQVAMSLFTTGVPFAREEGFSHLLDGDRKEGKQNNLVLGRLTESQAAITLRLV